MKKKNLSVLLALTFALISGRIFAQCTGCTTTVTTDASFTVAAGQTVCLTYSGNYNQTITLNGGTLCISTATTINGATITNSAASSIINHGIISQAIIIPAGYTLTNDGTISGTIALTGTLTNNSGATISGAITDNAGSTLNNSGTINNGSAMTVNGTITNNSGGNISTPVSIASGASVTTSGTMTGTITINNGGTFTNNYSGLNANITMNAGSTFDNNSTYSGTMTNNGGAINNNGTLSNTFTLNGSLANAGRVNAGITINTGGVMTNSGTVSGTITISGGTFLNASSTNLNAAINMTSGSFQNLSPSNYTGNLTESGGTVTNASGATISGTVNVTGGTLTNNGTETGNLSSSSGTTVTNNGTMTISGGGPVAGTFTSTTGSTTTNNITMSGAVNIGGTFTNNTNGNLSGTTTITGSLNNGGSMSGTVVISAGGTMTNNSNNVSGSTTITVNGTLANNAYNLQGNITVNSGGTVTNASGGLIQGGTLTGNAGSTITNNGTIADNISESGTLNNNSGGRISGTLAGLTGSTITNSGTIVNTVTISGGSFTNASGGSINGGSNLVVTGGTVTNSGSVTAVTISGGNVTNTSTINNLTISGGTLTNTGTLNGSMNISGGAITNASGATIDPSNFNTAPGSGSLTNNGTMNLPTGTTTIYSGYTVTNNGSMTSGPITVNSGGTLTLAGTETISGNIVNNGTVNLAGSLSLGSYTYSGTGTMNETSGGCNTFTVSSNTSTGTFNGGNSTYGGGLIVNTSAGTMINGASGTIIAPTVQASGLSLSVSALKVTGNFTAPSGTYSGFIVLRAIGTSRPPCHLTNYTAYSVGSAVGAYTVSAIISSGTPGARTFTDSIPSTACGDSSYYEIFSYNGAGECQSFDTINPLIGSIAIPAVTASISPAGPSTFCGSGTLTASGGGTYLWNVTGGSSTSNAITASASGNYAVTVTNNAGCTASASNVVTIIANPVVAAITGTTHECLGSTTTLTDATSGGVWSSSATGIATVAGGVVTGVAAGTSTISYAVTTSGCTTTVTVIDSAIAIPVVAAITGTTHECTGSTTTLSDATSGGVWSSSATGIATVAGGVVTGVAAGTSTISYAVTTLGCTTTVTKLDSALAQPAVTAITGTTSVCAGSTTQLSDATGSGVWSSSNTGVATITSSGLVTGIASGTSTISYTVTNASGCTKAVTATLTVNPLLTPSVSVSASATSICTGTSVTFTATPTNGGTPAYQWYKNGTAVGTNSATYINAALNNNDSVWVVMTSTATCASPATATSTHIKITVNTYPTVAAITGTTTVCPGSTTALSDATGSGVWSSSNTAIATVNSSTGVVTGVAPGTATITYTVTNASGCATEVTANVTVSNPGTIIPYLNPSSGGGWQSSTSVTLCAGGWVEFGSQSSVAGTGGTWTISGPNGFYSYSRDTTISNLLPVNSGTYVQTYYDASTGCNVSENFTITIQAIPNPNVNSPTVCAGGTAILTATGGGTYAWSTGSTTDTIMTNTSNTYTVTVTSSAGCSATTSGTSTISSATATVTVASGCGTGALSVLTASGGGTYLWSNADTTASISSGSVATYHVTVTSTAGCTATASATSSFYSGSGPSVTVSSNTPVCVGSTIDLTATPSGSTSYTYSWTGPDSFTSTSQAPTIPNGDTPDSGSYTVTVTDNHGCTVSATTSVLVNANCVDSVSVTVNNGGGSSYAPCTEILRFDHYNAVVASKPSGQNHTWILGNGNILTMNIKCNAGGFTAVASPSWSGSAFGVMGYTGLGGKTVLYTNASGYSKLTFSSIQLKDSLGNIIPNFTLVGIDGESTDNSERDTLTSNGTTWFDYDTINPPSPVGSIPTETGIGTNQLVWTASGPANARARLVSTNGPTNFTFSTVAGGLQGYAMGISNLVRANLDDTICSNTAFNNTPKNEPVGTTYTWAAPTVSPAGSVTGATAQTTGVSSVSQTLINTTLTTATVTYTVMPSNTCSNQGFTFHIFVKPNAIATILPGTPQCAGNTIIASAVTSPAATYTYKWTGPAGFTATGDSFTIASSTLANAGTYTVIITSSSGCHDTVSGPIQVVNCVSVSGSIFDDANGDGIMDGTDAATDLGQTLYSVLSDTTGKVVAVGNIAANGSFTMGQMLPNTSGFRVHVSTTPPAIGSPATGFTWPSGWVSTLGQYGSSNNSGSGVAPPGMLPIYTDTSNITNMLIGFDRLPTTTPQSYLIPYPGIGSTRQLNPANSLGLLTGTDPEDGSYSSGSTFIINSLAGMNGNELYYDANGDGVLQSWEQITGYTVITNYNPSRLFVKFTGAGSLSATFTYSAQDAAGNANLSPQNYVINWVGTLPVTLEYFTATQNNDHSSLLQWATATEIDNSYFEVERSPDAEQWVALGQVAGAGTSDQQHYYDFIDEAPLSGVNYYRLKQVDVDGHFVYTNIAEVTFDGLGSAPLAMSLFPNPVSASAPVTIELSNASAVISNISITNDMGQVVYSNASIQSNVAYINSLTLPAGVYAVTVFSDGAKPLTSRLVVR